MNLQPLFGDCNHKKFRYLSDAVGFVTKETEVKFRLFSYEYTVLREGCKKFVAISAEDLCSTILRSKHRYFNEIVLHGMPCHLYFDLDSYLSHNQERDFENIVNNFIHYVLMKLEEIFHISINRSNVIELQSSTAEKFSAHLIFHLGQNRYFRNNTEVYKFCLLLADGYSPESRDLPRPLNQFVVINPKNGRGMWIWDLQVYSPNQNFRTYLSSKLSRLVPFTLSEDCLFYKDSIQNVTDLRIFQDSLVSLCQKPQFCLLLKCQTPTLPEISSNFDGTVINRQFVNRSCQFKRSSGNVRLDAFVLQIIQHRNKNGYIRKVIDGFENGVLIFEIGNYRYCGNIKREHYSNHVKFVVNTKKFTLKQMCHDDVCKGFATGEISIPSYIFCK